MQPSSRNRRENTDHRTDLQTFPEWYKMWKRDQVMEILPYEYMKNILKIWKNGYWEQILDIAQVSLIFIVTLFCRVYGLNWSGKSISIRQWHSEAGIASLILHTQRSLTPPFGSNAWQFKMKLILQQLERFLFSLKQTVCKEVMTKRINLKSF